MLVKSLRLAADQYRLVKVQQVDPRCSTAPEELESEAMLKTFILNKVSQRQGLFDWLLILFLPNRSSRQRHCEEFVIVLL